MQPNQHSTQPSIEHRNWQEWMKHLSLRESRRPRHLLQSGARQLERSQKHLSLRGAQAT